MRTYTLNRPSNTEHSNSVSSTDTTAQQRHGSTTPSSAQTTRSKNAPPGKRNQLKL